MIEKILRTIKDNNMIQKGDGIVTGVSGGPDSVCLLHVLTAIREEYDLRLIAVHVNHMLRGEDAEEDQRFAEAYCAAIGVPCRTFRYDISALAAEKGMTSEEAGREARYASFFKVLAEEGAQRIAVAQNLNDQAETVLFRLIRGTGTDGLAGIDYVRDGVVIRPLLDVARVEIEAYCAGNGLEYRTDRTNLQPVYARNRIRLELLPLLAEKYNANIVSGLGRLARIAREDREFIDAAVSGQIGAHATIDRDDGWAAFPAAILAGLHPAVAKRIMTRLFKEIGLSQDIGAVHLESALRLVQMGTTSKSAVFPAGYSLRIAYGQARFMRKPEAGSGCFGLGTADLGIIKATVADRDQVQIRRDSAHLKCFDLDRIPGGEAGLFLRTRRPGDRFSPLGMEGSKKLKAFFIDEKVPLEERDRIPLVCAGTEILWVVGHRMSEKFKVRPETKRVLILEYQRPV